MLESMYIGYILPDYDKQNLINEEVGSTCSYWGGTKSFIRNAHTIWANYDKEENSITIKCWGDYRPMGRLVRPVIDK